MEKLMRKIEEDLINENYDGALNKFEQFLEINNWILQYATKEELAVYEILKSLDGNKKDYNQLLLNMIEMSGEDLTKEEKDDMMKLDKNFLKIILIKGWIERASKKVAKK